MDDGLVEALAADLQGWTVDTVAAFLGPVAHAALGREQRLPAVLRVREHPGERIGTLLALFVLGAEVPVSVLAAALPRLGADGAERLGLVSRSGAAPDDVARGLVDLRPYAAVDDSGTHDWWVVSDPGELATGAPLRADHVLGVGGASVTLARSTVRAPVDRVLDLGTGCGVQALHAARHARRVTATDVSARALRFARLTWSLNAAAVGGVSLDLRRGSLLEPVTGEGFDLVVSNPPFVITPRGSGATNYEYRDAGLDGDEVVRRLVQDAATVLRPGGIAQFLGNWEHVAGLPWSERVGAWVGEDVDAWVVQREVQDPAEYAETWLRDAGEHRRRDADDRYAAWLADFAGRGVEAVGFGLVTLRRPATGPATLRRLEERRDGPGLPTGHEVLAGLAAHDWLTGAAGRRPLEHTYRVAPDVSEERHHRPGEQDPAVILLRRGATGRSVRAGTALAAFVGACDGDLPAGVIVAAIAHLLDVDADALAAEIAAELPGLVTEGLLSPPA